MNNPSRWKPFFGNFASCDKIPGRCPSDPGFALPGRSEEIKPAHSGFVPERNPDSDAASRHRFADALTVAGADSLYGTEMLKSANPNPVTPPAGDVPENLMNEIAALIVTALNLDVAPSEIEPDAPLYSEGLGLDSIDILEVALEVSKQYGFQLRSDNDDNIRIFKSLRSLTDHVWRNRTA